jgi:hypothetical protein
VDADEVLRKQNAHLAGLDALAAALNDCEVESGEDGASFADWEALCQDEDFLGEVDDSHVQTSHSEPQELQHLSQNIENDPSSEIEKMFSPSAVDGHADAGCGEFNPLDLCSSSRSQTFTAKHNSNAAGSGDRPEAAADVVNTCSSEQIVSRNSESNAALPDSDADFFSMPTIFRRLV